MNEALTAADALLIERVEGENLAAQVEALADCGALPDARCLRVENAVAAITRAAFGRKLNHVVGFGLGAPFDCGALTTFETLYGDRGIAVEIDLCPFAESPSFDLLKQRGYAVNAFSNTYIHADLGVCRGGLQNNGIHVRDLCPAEAEDFVDWSVAGFTSQPTQRPVELLRLLAVSALRRGDTRLLVAEVEGRVAGTAAISIMQIEGAVVAHLFLASALPEFRRRGVQSALLHARLDQARHAGAVFATVTARPTNSSARNTLRAGFRLAYTKATFARQHECILDSCR